MPRGPAGLLHSSDCEPGITRRRAGRGFAYFAPDGDRIVDEATLARIRALAIPPAYREVWICADADGHLQATGKDARGRKQYRYHRDWTAVRSREKFSRIVTFGERLPRLRRRLRADLRRSGFPREKVAALVVAVMADTLARIGSRRYARANRSHGLTTLRNHHVAFLRGGRARLSFRGKGGIEHELELTDARLVKLVRRCGQLRGQSLFQYVDEDGECCRIGSGDVNDYLQERMGEDFTAKDFRTWGGTLAAIQALAAHPPPKDGQVPASLRVAVEREVAALLGNTPAVCRKSYIAPVVYAAWTDGWLARHAPAARGERQWETLAVRLLRAQQRKRVRDERKQRKERKGAR